MAIWQDGQNTQMSEEIKILYKQLIAIKQPDIDEDTADKLADRLANITDRFFDALPRNKLERIYQALTRKDPYKLLENALNGLDELIEKQRHE